MLGELLHLQADPRPLAAVLLGLMRSAAAAQGDNGGVGGDGSGTPFDPVSGLCLRLPAEAQPLASLAQAAMQALGASIPSPGPDDPTHLRMRKRRRASEAPQGAADLGGASDIGLGHDNRAEERAHRKKRRHSAAAAAPASEEPFLHVGVPNGDMSVGAVHSICTVEDVIGRSGHGAGYKLLNTDPMPELHVIVRDSERSAARLRKLLHSPRRAPGATSGVSAGETLEGIAADGAEEQNALVAALAHAPASVVATELPHLAAVCWQRAATAAASEEHELHDDPNLAPIHQAAAADTAAERQRAALAPVYWACRVHGLGLGLGLGILDPGPGSAQTAAEQAALGTCPFLLLLRSAAGQLGAKPFMPYRARVRAHADAHVSMKSALTCMLSPACAAQRCRAA